MGTFYEIITEPKFVVLSDITGYGANLEEIESGFFEEHMYTTDEGTSRYPDMQLIILS